MIYEIHGSLPQVHANKIAHRRMITSGTLLNWLNSGDKFVSITDALKGKGNAITIDDGIDLAYKTAKAIRAYGHEVTIFINGHNISAQENYFFVRLNHFLDYIVEHKIKLNFKDVDKFRADVKRKYILAKSNDECNKIINSLIDEFTDKDNIFIENSFSTIEQKHLHELHELGVTLGNHGWSHINYNNLTNEEFNHQFQKNDFWIRGLGLSFCEEYVIPFGKLNIGNKASEKIILLADKSLPAGWVTEKIYNRFSIDSDSDLETLQSTIQ